MGCCQGQGFDIDYQFSKDDQSKNQVFTFNPDLDQVKNPAVLSEDALINAKTNVIELYAKRNNIEPFSRNELRAHSLKISRHAIQKLSERDHKVQENQKIIIDPKLVKKAIKAY